MNKLFLTDNDGTFLTEVFIKEGYIVIKQYDEIADKYSKLVLYDNEFENLYQFYKEQRRKVTCL